MTYGRCFQSCLTTVLVLFMTFPVSSCATMISGSHQDIRIETHPRPATLVVMGGALGAMMAKAKSASDTMKMILRLLSPFATDEDLAFLEKVDFESLLTAMVLEVQGKKPLPRESISQGAAKALAHPC